MDKKLSKAIICTIYSRHIGLEKVLDRIREIFPTASLKIDNDDGFQVATFEFRSGFLKSRQRVKIPYRERDEGSLSIDSSADSPLANNLAGLYRYACLLPAHNEKVRTLFLKKILSFNSEFSIIQERGSTKEITSLIKALAKDFDAVLFVQPNTVISKSSSQHFLDRNLNLIIDGEGNCEIDDLDGVADIKQVRVQQVELTAEQNQRKEKSEIIIMQRGIKINKYLPCIETENETRIRTPKMIAERLIVLGVTNMVAFNTMSNEEATEYLKKYEFWDKVTHNEKSFLADPTDEKKAMETWKCEAIWVLMWALKKVNELGFPDKLCNLNDISYENYPIGENKDPNEFISLVGEPRAKSEIMDANDLYYRIHWACVDARINNKSSLAVNPDVVYQRHYALNWLLNYMDQEWDDISCDT